MQHVSQEPPGFKDAPLKREPTKVDRRNATSKPSNEACQQHTPLTREPTKVDTRNATSKLCEKSHECTKPATPASRTKVDTGNATRSKQDKSGHGDNSGHRECHNK